MSRTKAMQSFTWSGVKKQLAAAVVELLSSGLDEVPGVYKDIDTVMAAQTDLVEVLGRFDPKLVKMCPPRRSRGRLKTGEAGAQFSFDRQKKAAGNDPLGEAPRALSPLEH